MHSTLPNSVNNQAKFAKLVAEIMFFSLKHEDKLFTFSLLMRVLHLTFAEATAEVCRSFFLWHSSFSGVTAFSISKLREVNSQFLAAETASSLLGLNLSKITQYQLILQRLGHFPF